MKLEEKVEIIDRALIRLREEGRGLIPELIDGFNKYPRQNSDLDIKYRIVEQELLEFGLARKIGGGDNSRFGGYIDFKITSKGLELLSNNESVEKLYKNIQQANEQEKQIQELTLENLEYQKAIRDQQNKIRNMDERLKKMELPIKRINLVKSYWWLAGVILSLIGNAVLIFKVFIF